MSETTTDREPLNYSAFANELSWQLNSLCFQAKATTELLHASEADIDVDSNLLGTSYLLQTIAQRAEELALQVSDSQLDYVLKSPTNATSQGSADE